MREEELVLALNKAKVAEGGAALPHDIALRELHVGLTDITGDYLAFSASHPRCTQIYGLRSAQGLAHLVGVFSTRSAPEFELFTGVQVPR